MADPTSFRVDPTQPTIVVTRTFDAPRALVYEALTRPEHVARWYGPRRHATPICHADLRPGGAWRVVQRGADGREFAFRGVYRELTPPSRIVRTWVYEGQPESEIFETAQIEALAGRTTVTLSSVFPSLAARDAMAREGAEEGGRESLDRLAELLTTVPVEERAPVYQLALTRLFDAPRSLVFEAWSTAEHLRRWFPPKGFVLSECKLGFQAGGPFDICMDGHGMKARFTGRFTEVVPVERLAWAGEFPGASPGPNQVHTLVTFEEVGSKTRVTVQQSFAVLTPATEPMAKGSPIGWGETLDQLGGYAVELTRAAKGRAGADRRV